MEKRAFGRTGMQVSVLGFGGSEIGHQHASQSDVDRLLNSALDAGLNVIDTAECYKNSEELIGKAVGHRRRDYFLFTKVGHENGWDAGEDYSAAAIARTIERSLQRLKTDVLDLVQFHSCSAATLKKDEAIEALRRAKAAGKTRFIGYSGDSTDARAAIDCGAFDTLQTSVNIADQEAIDLLLPEAAKRGMGVIAKRPIANAAWRYSALPEEGYHVEYWNRLRELKFDFATTGAARPDAASIALRFTLAMPGVHTAIVGTTNPQRWKQNAEMLKAGPLPKAQIDAIRANWKSVACKDWVGQV